MAKKKLSYEINWAENLEFMSCLKSESINFIYIDPPFNTSKVQKRNKEKYQGNKWAKFVVDLQYYDSFGNGTNGYLQFMKPRLEHCHRLLKEDGVLCVHLDYRSVHYVKCLLDKIFGYGNIDSGKDHLVNEIIWTYNRWTAKSNSFQNIHDTILIYSKTKKYTFNEPMIDHSLSSLKEYKFLEKPNGEIIKLNKHHLLGCEKIPKGERFRTLRRQDTKGTPKDRQYLKDYPKVRAGSVLKIPFAGAKERIGYPTQKPVALIEKFIEAFTNKNEIVADFFCGCSTTLEASMNLERSFIGCDGQEKVLKVLKERILKRPQMRKHKIKAESPFSKIPKSFDKMDWKDYERKSILCVGGIPNAVQTSDGGWDGIRISDGALIQAKKHKSKTGRPDLQKFVGTMVYRGKKKGVFISHTGFSQEARDFVSDVRKDGYIIELKTSHYLKKEAELKEKEFSSFNDEMRKSS